MKITRRKKTDEGVVIPEWARRGWINVMQFGMGGPVNSSIHFRVCPSDGMVTVYFTGQNEDGEMFEEIECAEFYLSSGFGAVATLENGLNVPFFDRMHFGNPEKVSKLARGLTFSPAFANHETRFLTYCWKTGPPDSIVLRRLPVDWWLHWFENVPDLEDLDLSTACPLVALGSPVDADSFRERILAANGNIECTPWLREVDLKSLGSGGWNARHDGSAEEEDDSERPIVEVLSEEHLWEQQKAKRHVARLRRFGAVIEDLKNRLVAIDQTLRTNATVGAIDLEDLFFGVQFLDPPPRNPTGDPTRVVEWMRAIAMGPPRWWRDRDRSGGGSKKSLTERLLGNGVLDRTDLGRLAGPLAPSRSMTWPEFGAASLTWLLGTRPDASLAQLADREGHGLDVCRFAYVFTLLQSYEADRLHHHQYSAMARAKYWPFKGLRAVFPASVRDEALEAARMDRFPILEDLEDQLEIPRDATLDDMLATSESIKRVFDSIFKPIGIHEEDVANSRTLRYHLLWEAWRSMTASTEVSASHGAGS